MIGPELPPDAEHVWRWFLELDGARGGGGFGPSPITYPDILAWAALTGAAPRPAEVAAIKALDGARLTAWAQGEKKPDPKKKRERG